MRTASVDAPHTWPKPKDDGRAIELSLKALTPIYKGGSTTDQVDEGRPFRVPSIRGALRYWWRATTPLADVRELRTREEEIFGGVHRNSPMASAVSVAVLGQSSKTGPRPEKPYAFGVAGTPEGEAKNKQVHLAATGKLRIEWRDGVGHDVRRALHAWLLFGGIGGRSRRGAGSVWWDGEEITTPTSTEEYLALSRALVPQRSGANSPTLVRGVPDWPLLAGGVLLIGPEFGSADDAWTEGLDGMRDVRASLGVRPAFAPMRNLLEWKNQDYIPLSRRGTTFTSPRAALGLPIQFNSRARGFQGVMTVSGHNRYPSPVHLKVIQLGSKFHPAFIILRGRMPTHLIATRSHDRQDRTRGRLDHRGLDRFIDLAAKLPGWNRHHPW